MRYVRKIQNHYRVEAGIVKFPYLQRSVEVYLKREGKNLDGIIKLIEDYTKKDPEYIKKIMEKKGFQTIKELAEYINR